MQSLLNLHPHHPGPSPNLSWTYYLTFRQPQPQMSTKEASLFLTCSQRRQKELDSQRHSKHFVSILIVFSTISRISYSRGVSGLGARKHQPPPMDLEKKRKRKKKKRGKGEKIRKNGKGKGRRKENISNNLPKMSSLSEYGSSLV